MLRWRRHPKIEFEDHVENGESKWDKIPEGTVGMESSKQMDGWLHLSLNKEGRSMDICGCMKIAKLGGEGVEDLLAKKLLVPQ